MPADRRPGAGRAPGAAAAPGASARPGGTSDDDTLLPAPMGVPDGVPVSELVNLTPPEQVVRAALARAKQAARARGLRPGVVRSRPVSSGSAPGARDPQPLSVSAGLLARDLGWEPGLVVGDLVHRWAQIVGPQIADHCEYVSFTSGLLTVRASSTAWAANLRLLAPAMLARFDEALGEGVVVQVDVLGPVGHGFGRGPRRVAGRGPRDTYG
ncbi:DciA family protein [Cellulomonas sp. zg-ZUI22]|nr:DciA family protein [Cellulomonas sp. zg-ZUI22]